MGTTTRSSRHLPIPVRIQVPSPLERKASFSEGVKVSDSVGDSDSAGVSDSSVPTTGGETHSPRPAASVCLCGAEDFTIQADKKIIEPGENLNFELIRNSEGHLMHGVGFHAFYPDAPQGIGKGKVVFTRKANRLVDTCYIFLPKGRTRWFPRQLHTLKKITHTLNTENWPEGDYRIGLTLLNLWKGW